MSTNTAEVLPEVMPRPGMNQTLLMAILALGPALNVFAVLKWVDPTQTTYWLVALLFVAWSPFFMSLPALLLQDSRDWALNWMWSDNIIVNLPISFARGIALLPYMLFSTKSTVRTEMAVSIIGWVLAVAMAWSHIDVTALPFIG